MAAAAEGIQKKIAEMYNISTDILESTMGEHVHHGFYEPGVSSTLADHPAAAVRMIEEVLRFAGVSDDLARRPMRVVDVGCGIGGSSRFLAKKYGAQVQGITLSPVQAHRAQVLTVAAGLGDKVSYHVADALAQPFPDNYFDLVWSMESGEHMPDKTKFVSELARVAKPGATIIIVTWCHRELSPSEKSLTPDETDLLNTIKEGFCLAPWCPTSDYVKIAKSFSLKDIKTADWSENVAPFWPAVIRSQYSTEGLTTLLKAGANAIKSTGHMPLMIEGYYRKLITFSLITCRKPE